MHFCRSWINHVQSLKKIDIKLYEVLQSHPHPHIHTQKKNKKKTKKLVSINLRSENDNVHKKENSERN